MHSNISILVVEDDLIISANLVENLHSLGYDMVFEARDSDEALMHMSSQNISIIFMDIQLKGSKLDGIELSEQINKQYPKTQIIFLTGFANQDNLNRASGVLHENFLAKPVSAQQLFASIQRALAGNEKSITHSAGQVACPWNQQNEEIYVRLQKEKYFNRILVADIIYMMTNNKGVDIVTANHTYFAYSSMGEIVEKINNKNIVQIHKKYALNRAHITLFSNMEIILSSGKTLPIGRNYKYALIDLGLVII
jgi:DNA-binding LytR/AlgR family response regulator